MGKAFNLDDLYTNLEETFKVFGHLILEHNYQKDNFKMSWSNYKSGITKNIYYAQEYEELVRDRQFSFLLMDQSMIQIYYEFNGNQLIKYKLAFYPHPVLTIENLSQLEDYYCHSYDETLCDFYQDLLQEESLKLTNTSHLRFDYDHAVTSHAKSELQIGSINNIRISSQVLIYPFIFVDFIIKNLFRQNRKYQDIIQSVKYKNVYDISNKKGSMKVEEFQESSIYLTLAGAAAKL